MARTLTIALFLVVAWGVTKAMGADAPLLIEARIPLGEIGWRIDHLAYDPTRGRIYVAELGNNTVGIVDVANGGDGTVRLFGGEDFAALETLHPGNDADNVRVDASAQRVYVGYGSRGLAVIDPATRKQTGTIRLEGHPESFQLDPAGRYLFVNVPEAGHIAVVDHRGLR